MIDRDCQKQQIATRFGQAASTYNAHATVQQTCARSLLQIMDKYESSLPEGAVLEIGCGTGLISQGLVQRFSQRQLLITDLSPEMWQFCQSALAISAEAITFASLDGEQLQNLPAGFPDRYAAIVSGFVLQWFQDPHLSLCDWIDRLQTGGCLFLSFPTRDCFPEWRSICEQLQLPYTANPLPDPVQLLQSLPDSIAVLYASTQTETVLYAGAAAFFRSLKAIGAGTNQTQKQLSARQMRQLIQDWDSQLSGKLQIRYQVAIWVIQRCV